MYTEIAANKRRSYLLIACFIGAVTFLGWVFGQITGDAGMGVTLAFIMAIFSAFFSYYYSDKIVLAISQAREVSLESDWQLYQIVENLCIATGLPRPRVYVIDDTAPNAFATGRNPEHAVICVTTGLLMKLDKRELEGVIAHEMAHVKNYDMLVMTLTVVLVGVISLLSDWILRFTFWGGRSRKRDENRGGGQVQLVLMIVGIVLAVVAPLIATLIKLAVSRQREYLADASAALITRYPEGLARALEKIAGDREPLEAANKATAHLYIVNPLKDHASAMNSLFSTHPPIGERVQRLRSM
ncbi:MAG TPA: zinc metalloprotease HtpX [bacterium]|nr:zinc metalloprotease HtpX [bacterium]